MIYITPTNTQIKNALEDELKKPVFYSFLPDNSYKKTGYVLFYETAINIAQSRKFLDQTIQVDYISVAQNKLRELDIIKKLENIGLFFDHTDYDREQVLETNTVLDIVHFYFIRKIRREC